MRYSVEPRERIYVKGYGFLFFAKNMGKSLNNKYGQKSNNNNNNNEDVEITPHKKRYISPEERKQIISELRSVPKKDTYF